MLKIDQFFTAAGNWFIDHTELLHCLSDELKHKINQQVTRAFAFGLLVGFCVGLLLKL